MALPKEGRHGSPTAARAATPEKTVRGGCVMDNSSVSCEKRPGCYQRRSSGEAQERGKRKLNEPDRHTERQLEHNMYDR